MGAVVVFVSQRHCILLVSVVLLLFGWVGVGVVVGVEVVVVCSVVWAC